MSETTSVYSIACLQHTFGCMNRQEHWNNVYESKGPLDTSWYQRRPDFSLALIAATGVAKGEALIDVGGGASSLVDCLLDEGYSRLAVLDLSAAALNFARARLGPRAETVEWFAADVTTFNPPHEYGLCRRSRSSPARAGSVRRRTSGRW